MPYEPHVGVPEDGAPEQCQLCPLLVRHPSHLDPTPVPVVTAATTPAQETAIAAGEARRDRAMQVAIDHAPEDWKIRAIRELARLAASGREFTSEDLTDVVGLPTGGKGTNANNAVGSFIGAARKRGVIVWTNKVLPSRVKTSNAAMLKVWVGADHAHRYHDAS